LDTLKKFYEEVFNKHNPDAADQFIAKDGVDHGAMPGIKPGLEGIKEEFKQFFTAFPDWNITVEDMIADGDKVAARTTIKGTNKGAAMGLPGNGDSLTSLSLRMERYKSAGVTVTAWP
jgi:steroid delta-isomerase-like uncharacterized protein